MLTHDELVAKLRERKEQAGSLEQAARQLGVSTALLGAVLTTHGQFHREINRRLAEALGYRPVVLFEPIPRRAAAKNRRRRKRR